MHRTTRVRIRPTAAALLATTALLLTACNGAADNGAADNGAADNGATPSGNTPATAAGADIPDSTQEETSKGPATVDIQAAEAVAVKFWKAALARDCDTQIELTRFPDPPAVETADDLCQAGTSGGPGAYDGKEAEVTDATTFDQEGCVIFDMRISDTNTGVSKDTHLGVRNYGGAWLVDGVWTHYHLLSSPVTVYTEWEPGDCPAPGDESCNDPDQLSNYITNATSGVPDSQPNVVRCSADWALAAGTEWAWNQEATALSVVFRASGGWQQLTGEFGCPEVPWSTAPAWVSEGTSPCRT